MPIAPTHPIENKERVKSFDEVLKETAVDKIKGTDGTMWYSRWSVEQVSKAYHAAQFTPIEQGKSMVSVEDVIELIRKYPHMSLSSTHELIEQIKNLNQA